MKTYLARIKVRLVTTRGELVGNVHKQASVGSLRGRTRAIEGWIRLVSTFVGDFEFDHPGVRTVVGIVVETEGGVAVEVGVQELDVV
jgi:hypothetical protein